MTLAHSPRIVTDGLVFAYDMENTKKSWKGKPTTNLVADAATMTGWGAYSSGNDGTFITEFGTTGYKIINRNTWNGLAKGITLPAPGTYTISAWFRIWGKSANNNGINVYTSGGGISDTSQGGDDTRIGEWQRISMTRTYTTTSITFYIISWGGTSGVDWSSWDVTMPQVEQNSFATPFVNGTRSNTEAILDLTGNNTVTATDLTYNTDGTFDFESGKYATIPNPITNGQPYTILMVAKPDSLSTAAYNSSSGRSTILRGDGHWNPGIWMTQNTIRSHCTTEYRDTNIDWSDLRTSMVGMTFDGTNCFNVFDGKIQAGTRTSYAPGTPSTIIIGNDVLAGTTYPWDGKIYMMLYYNRALSAEEVQQNFNAIRGRYGI